MKRIWIALPVWRRMWIFRLPCVEKDLSQISHLKSFTPECVFRCAVSVLLTANERKHCVHLKGLSCVCMRAWRMRSEGFLNSFEQCVHWWYFTPATLRIKQRRRTPVAGSWTDSAVTMFVGWFWLAVSDTGYARISETATNKDVHLNWSFRGMFTVQERVRLLWFYGHTVIESRLEQGDVSRHGCLFRHVVVSGRRHWRAVHWTGSSCCRSLPRQTAWLQRLSDDVSSGRLQSTSYWEHNTLIRVFSCKLRL